MKQFFYLLVICVTLSCNNRKKETPDGGPCSYEDKIYPAKLIKLDPSPDSSEYDAWFEINRLNDAPADYRDTVHYSPHNYRIPGEEVKKDSIAVGKVYKFISSTLKTGSCNPHVENVILERY
jgi:hypothetical protein